jgi:hypothetical protein
MPDQDRATGELRRRRLLMAAGLGTLAAGATPGAARAQIMPRPTPDAVWITNVRHISIGATVRVQNPGDRVWHGLRRQYVSGDPPQASSDGLIQNDIDGDPNRPSLVNQRVQAMASRVLAPVPARRVYAGPRPQLLTTDMRLTEEELQDMLYLTVQFFIRDISQDLIVPPPARVASVMLTEIVLYQRPTQRLPIWPSGPVVSVETVVRAHATEWMLERLDATVARVLERWTLL